DGNAIGDGDGEQHAAPSSGVAVDALENEPPVVRGVMPPHLGAVYLMAQDDDGERLLLRGAERAPPGHHLPHALGAPQAQAEPMPTRRDARDEPVALGPLAQLHTRHGAVAHVVLAKQRMAAIRLYGSRRLRFAQSGPPAPAAARRCARSRVR